MHSKIALILFQNSISAWQLAEEHKCIPINAQDISPLEHTNQLIAALEDLRSRLDDTHNEFTLEIILDDTCASIIKENFDKILKIIQPQVFQIHSWQSLAKRLDIDDSTNIYDGDTLEELIFPWIFTENDANLRKKLEKTLLDKFTQDKKTALKQQADIHQEQLIAKDRQISSLESDYKKENIKLLTESIKTDKALLESNNIIFQKHQAIISLTGEIKDLKEIIEKQTALSHAKENRWDFPNTTVGIIGALTKAAIEASEKNKNK